MCEHTRIYSLMLIMSVALIFFFFFPGKEKEVGDYYYYSGCSSPEGRTSFPLSPFFFSLGLIDWKLSFSPLFSLLFFGNGRGGSATFFVHPFGELPFSPFFLFPRSPCSLVIQVDYARLPPNIKLSGISPCSFFPPFQTPQFNDLPSPSIGGRIHMRHALQSGHISHRCTEHTCMQCVRERRRARRAQKQQPPQKIPRSLSPRIYAKVFHFPKTIS